MTKAKVELDLGGDDVVSLEIDEPLEVREIMRRCGIEIEEHQNFVQGDCHLDSGDTIDPAEGNTTLVLHTGEPFDEDD